MKDKKRYRFNVRTGRNIEVVFSHIPDRRISTGTKDMAEAIMFAEHFLETDGIIKPKVPRFSEFAKDYFTRTDDDSLHARHVSFDRVHRDGWYTQCQGYLDHYIMPKYGDYELDVITAVSIENWIASVKGYGRTTISPNTKLKILDSFSTIMDDVVRLGYRQDNPVEKIMKPTNRQVMPRRPLTLYEQGLLFPNDADKRVAVYGSIMWATYFSVMYDTGFRPSEVAGLRVCDVYRTPKGMGVYTTHTINSEEHTMKERVKTSGKGMDQRVGLLSGITQSLVERLIKGSAIRSDEELLFLIRRWDKESWVLAATSNRHFREVCERLGLDSEITQYYIRHTYATYRRGDVDENTLALAMGHANGVRNDYDHRSAAILIGQLEANREQLFDRKSAKDEEQIIPLGKKTAQ